MSVSIATHGEATYRVELADSARALAAVHALRAFEYANGQPYLSAADTYDERSYVFGCYSDRSDAPVATCRFTMAESGRYELDDLAAGWPKPPVPPQALLETSRVVITRAHRATGLLEAMLLMAGSWVLARTSYRYNFAVCARPLQRLYARLGMQRAMTEELTLRGRPAEKRYVIIYGDMAAAQPRVSERLRSGGWLL